MTEALQQEAPKQNGNIIPLSIDADNGQQNLRNGSSSKKRSNSVDPDAQEMLISSLRAQIQDLFAQVSQLNSKLVKSYDRVSDLEDELHVASANLRTSSVKISQLELERTQHLSALNTGLLVEKSHVTTELNRLMEKATEEAAQRGQAESARNAIEKELDDLSASLFDQANTMVAEARFAKHLSERKVEDAERALKSAEEAVQLMQIQMQSMQAEKEEMEKRSRKMEMVMGRGKWAERHDDISIPLRLLNSHAPYQDYFAFLTHLRVLHPTSPSPPAMTTLLPLPFLARLLNEDSEPTVRLDLAPSLNWLSRRSVLAAIHSGQLTIEPISAASLFTESSSTTIAGVHSSNDNISCALCGTPVFPVTEPSHPSRPPTHPSNPSFNSSSWSGSFFKRTSSSNSSSRPPSPTHSITRSSSIGSTSQIYIFRLASLPTTAIPSLPISSLSKSSFQSTSSSIPSQSALITNGLPSASPNHQSVTIYPLCMSGWCLSRLRTTCTLWAFVRSGIVEKVWEEAVIAPPMPPPTTTISQPNGEKPSLPPRKRGLWGIASAIGERAASWSEGDKDKTKKPSSLQEPRRLPPPLPPSRPPIAAVPPPLPKRNEGRSRNPTSKSPLPQPSIDNPTNTQTDPSPSTVSPVPEMRVHVKPVPSPPPAQEMPVHVRASSPASPPPAQEMPVHVRASSPVPSPSPVQEIPAHAGASSPVPSPPPVQEIPVHIGASSPVPSPPPVQEMPVHVRASSSDFTSRSLIPASLIPGRGRIPANIPLPDSRPSTPPVLLSRTSTSAANGNSGVPPPLPRRAATRGQRGTAAAAAAAARASRASTPANGFESTVALGPPVTDKISEDPTPKVDEQVNDGPNGSDDNLKTGESVEAGNKILLDRPSGSQSPASDLYMDAPSFKSEDMPSAVGLAEEEEAKKDEEDNKTIIDVPMPVNDPVLGTVEAVVNGPHNLDKAKTNGEIDHDHIKGVVEYEQAASTAQALGVKGEDRKETEATDGRQYVGDSTWEEKTWKELVRLREDMYWARVGGFRG